MLPCSIKKLVWTFPLEKLGLVFLNLVTPIRWSVWWYFCSYNVMLTIHIWNPVKAHSNRCKTWCAWELDTVSWYLAYQNNGTIQHWTKSLRCMKNPNSTLVHSIAGTLGVYSSSQVYGEVMTRMPLGTMRSGSLSKNFMGSGSLQMRFPANTQPNWPSWGRLQASPTVNCTRVRSWVCDPSMTVG